MSARRQPRPQPASQATPSPQGGGGSAADLAAFARAARFAAIARDILDVPEEILQRGHAAVWLDCAFAALLAGYEIANLYLDAMAAAGARGREPKQRQAFLATAATLRQQLIRDTREEPVIDASQFLMRGSRQNPRPSHEGRERGGVLTFGRIAPGLQPVAEEA